MNSKKLADFEPEDLGVNPYLEALEILVKRRTVHHEFVADRNGTVNVKVVEYDATPKTSIFIVPENRKIINGLDSSAKELLLWLFYNFKQSQDYIQINRERYMKECNIKSKSTYYSAIKNLLFYNILIATAIYDVYWFNPNYFYRGSRVNDFPSKLISDGESDDYTYPINKAVVRPVYTPKINPE